MRSMNLLQLIGGVAAAGVVAAGATAVTGSGVVRTGTAADQWVGGTVTQTMTGANITGVVYHNVTGDLTKTQIDSIAITLTGASGKHLTITTGGGTFSSTGNTPADAYDADEWACTGDITAPVAGATPTNLAVNASPATITCVPTLTAGALAQGFYRNLATLQMAVS